MAYNPYGSSTTPGDPNRPTGGYATITDGPAMKPVDTSAKLAGMFAPPPAASGGTAPVSSASNVNYGVYGDLLKNAYGTLGREGDAAGIDQWTKYIQQLAQGGMSGEAINKHVMDAFASTPEAMAYSQSGKDPSQIQYGSALDQSRRSGGEMFWRDQGGDSGGQIQDYKPITWDTNGLNFGATPEMGATPIIDPQTGKFMGWQGKNGNNWTTKDAWTAADTGIRGMSGGDESLYNQMARPILAQNGNWVMSDAKAREAPEAFQHGPNNFMERLASKSPYIIAAMAAGGAGMAASGMTAAEASAAVSGGAAGGGGAAGAGGLTELGTGSVASTVAADTGLVDAGTLAGGAAGGAGGGATGLTELGSGAVPELSSASTIAEAETPWWQTAYDYAKTANEYKGYYDKANKAYNMINPQEQRFQPYNEGYTPDYSESEPGGSSSGIPSTGGKPFDWNAAGKAGGSLADLFGAWYSAQQLKDQAGNEKAPFSRQNGLQDPYNMMLAASYANPETYYGTSQWKGLKDVYKNDIDRKAGAGGTLANPMDREVKLNNYAMKSLEDYRTGLRGAVNAYDASKYNSMYSSGLNHEANANTGAFATASKGGTAGYANTVKQYIEAGKSAKEIYDFVSDWF